MAKAGRRAVKPQSPLFVPEVEAVRGVAAMFVALGHTYESTVIPAAGTLAHLPSSLTMLLQQLLLLRVKEGAAVIVFFVISGFVLGRALDAHRAPSLAAGYISFLWRRVWRIYPAHIVALLIITPMGVWVFAGHPIRLDRVLPLPPDYVFFLGGEAFKGFRWQALASNLVLKWNLFNPATWSLQVEVLTCVVFPFFYAIARKRNVIFDLAVMAIFAGISFAWHVEYGRLLFFLQYVPAFYLGLTVETWGKVWAGYYQNRSFAAMLGMFVSYAVVAAASHLLEVRDPVAILIESLGCFSFLSLVVWGKGGVLRGLNSPWLRWNGRISYSFYLWHFACLLLVEWVAYGSLPSHIIVEYNVLFFLCVLGLSVFLAAGLAFLSYRAIEKPFIRYGRKTSARFISGE